MGQLFGSVTSSDIAEAVSEAGFTISRSQVVMDKAIKTLGLTDTRIRLHPEVHVDIIVNIARSLEEAGTQLKTGVAVTGGVQDIDDEDDNINVAVAAVEAVEKAESAEAEAEASEESAETSEDADEASKDA